MENKTKSLTIYPSQEQYKVIMKMLLEEQVKQGKKISVSKYIVDTFLPSKNGNSPPSLPTTSKETKENVSTGPWDTDFLNDFLDQKKE